MSAFPSYLEEPVFDPPATPFTRPTAQPTQPPPRKGWEPPAVVSYGADFDVAAIPRRRFLLGGRRSVGEVTIDVGPPGANKSSLLTLDAVSITSGRPTLKDDVHRTGDVLMLIGEDSRRDFEARLAGILQHYGISPADLGGRLHCVYLAEIDPLMYSLAGMARDLTVMNERLLQWIRDFPELVALLIDPIAAWHHVLENDTGAMKVLCTGLRRLAVVGDLHVGFDHHVTKASMVDPEFHVGNLAAARGAFMTGDARWMFTMAKLKPETASSFGIPEDDRKRWRRLDPLKASYGPDDGEARLLYVQSVLIPNGEEVPVLTEGNRDNLQAAAADRRVTAELERTKAIADALTTMLTEKAPRSGDAAAIWLQGHRPELFPGRGGAPLSSRTIRERLPGLIGVGLATVARGRPERIVCRQAGVGHGARWEIAFHQTAMEDAP